MGRGKLRVMLGAAPGVGKTYAMLEEGRRLAAEGKDVVVAVVETHDRVATAAMLEGLEAVPRRTIEHRGVALTEMDLEAVLARAPEIALVDEFAHTNAPGSEHEKRWQDVAELLDAGISVFTTVNIQHIDSLNDVVEQITGIVQRETIPDSVLRAADQIEVVDLAPQSLRDRLSDGLVYPAARIDAALSNYFRLGNLTALRELALLWLADEVDTALNKYRLEHGIDSKWEARERVVVALTGGPEGETLIRRGARIAARAAGGELIAVHVTGQEGLREAHPGALAAQRALVEKLGGSYHQVVGDDVPGALVEFARASNATQLVIGVSRRSRLLAFLTGQGVGQTVVRASGDIDVHIVTHGAAGTHQLVLPRARGALSIRRMVYGFVVALVLGPALTGALWYLRDPDALASDTLAFQLLVVVVALIGGIWPALFAAVLSGFTLDFFFVEPYYTITIARPLHLVALLLYVVSAVLVSFVVDQAARRSRAARRAAAESEVLATVSGSIIRGGDTIAALVSRAREAFGLTAVVLRGDDGAQLHSEGDVTDAGESEPAVYPVGERAFLELYGPELQSSNRRILNVIATQLDAALEHLDLTDAAEQLGPLAETDRVRSALLAALGHDLRRPLAAATAAVTSLRSPQITLSERDTAELLETAQASLENLNTLVTNLLDVSRVQAGVLAVTLENVDVDDVLPSALEELAIAPGGVVLDVHEHVPPVRADPVLLQRVLVNLLANALRFSAAAPLLSVSSFDERVQIRIVDSGPGVPDERKEAIFEPFQREGDTDNSTGIGLGLALSRGFVEGMGGTLDAEDTPGGGLTMVVELPCAQGAAGAGRDERRQPQDEEYTA